MSWSTRAPKTTQDRRALKVRCGAKAFLVPKKLKYPVIAKGAACRPSCDGLKAAYARAQQFHHPSIAVKAKQLARRARCSWV